MVATVRVSAKVKEQLLELHELDVRRKKHDRSAAEIRARQAEIVEQLKGRLTPGQVVKVEGLTLEWRETTQSRSKLSAVIERLRGRLKGKQLEAMEQDIAETAETHTRYWVKLVAAEPTRGRPAA